MIFELSGIGVLRGVIEVAAVMTNFNGAMLLALENIAHSKGLSVSDFIRQTMIERLEDEEDLRDAREALMELEQDPTLYDFEELKDEWLK